MSDKELVVAGQQAMAEYADQSVPMGFEDEEEGDMIIPRIKVVQTLSPERKDKIAEEGDIINSLTKEKLNGKVFIPVFKFNNNIEWRDRTDGGGIACIARDGITGVCSDGTTKFCKACGRNEFDNTKTGKESFPKCTKYINFFGFFTGDRIPTILSFSKTNMAEGKKLYSLAKVTMQNMWHYGYHLNEKLLAKNGNEWYVIIASTAGPTSPEDREYAANMYKMFRTNAIKYDMDGEEVSGTASEPVMSEKELANTDF